MGNDSRPFAIGGPSIKVTVTEHDIAWATRDDSSRCMVARAIAREVVDAAHIEVDTQTIRFSTTEARFAYLTPLTVQRYVAAFDAGDPIQPFEFRLRNPMQLRRRIFTPEEKAAARLARLTEDTNRKRKTRSSLPPKERLWLGKDTPQAKRSKDGQVAPPRVFKTRMRTYGHRILRINQPMQATALDEPQP